MSRTRLLLHRTPLRTISRAYRQSFHSSHHVHANLPLPFPLQSRFRFRWSYLWYASMLALGVTAGLGARNFILPFGLVPAGSDVDKLVLASLSQDIDNLEVVQSLRSQSYNLHTDTALRSGPGISSTGGGGRKISAYKGWLELDLDFGRENEGWRGLLGVMGGSRGLGVQRAFWNAETREMVAVVWIGGALNGWPGIAHGGAVATIFEEILARMVKGPEGIVEPVHRPNSLSITYKKPTPSFDFCILRASFSNPDLAQTAPPSEPEAAPPKSWLSPQNVLTKKTEPATQKQEIVATLETVKGDLCAVATATFGG
ncbi:hypothetical protein BDW02DRAFT_596824 [Decorospora gaudefroyi]|uniref:Thioesterase domain-containing protein n=1 Tax=Decorospora gaudefroyi TaxID=184978 RepID=A0A6A5KL28_9PLEO|nr:hypothetical protein BDW02DRAFT_596824 [Decorospora gaudefroyi]